MSDQQVIDFISHYGKKGMQWGVRSSRKEVRRVSKRAGQLIKESGNARTTSERKAVAKKYENEVLNTVRSKEFREKYRVANTMTKGDMAVHVVLLGPLAALTIPQVKRQMASNRTFGPDIERDAARTVLKELNKPL